MPQVLEPLISHRDVEAPLLPFASPPQPWPDLSHDLNISIWFSWCSRKSIWTLSLCQLQRSCRTWLVSDLYWNNVFELGTEEPKWMEESKINSMQSWKRVWPSTHWWNICENEEVIQFSVSSLLYAQGWLAFMVMLPITFRQRHQMMNFQVICVLIGETILVPRAFQVCPSSPIYLATFRYWFCSLSTHSSVWHWETWACMISQMRPLCLRNLDLRKEKNLDHWQPKECYGDFWWACEELVTNLPYQAEANFPTATANSPSACSICSYHRSLHYFLHRVFWAGRDTEGSLSPFSLKWMAQMGVEPTSHNPGIISTMLYPAKLISGSSV